VNDGESATYEARGNGKLPICSPERRAKSWLTFISAENVMAATKLGAIRQQRRRLYDD